MSAHTVHVFHPHHWHVHEEIIAPPGAEAVHDPDGAVVNAFRIAAATYFALTMSGLGLLFSGVIPPSALGGRMLLVASAGFLATALTAVGALLYSLPHWLGGGLWSVKLAWTHFAALNAAVLVPVWFLVFDRSLADLIAGELLAVVVVLHAGAIGSLIANMFESVGHIDWPGRKSLLH